MDSSNARGSGKRHHLYEMLVEHAKEFGHPCIVVCGNAGTRDQYLEEFKGQEGLIQFKTVDELKQEFEPGYYCATYDELMEINPSLVPEVLQLEVKIGSPVYKPTIARRAREAKVNHRGKGPRDKWGKVK